MNKQISLKEIALLVNGEIAGDAGLEIHGFGPLESATVGEMSFLVKSGRTELLEQSSASAFLVPADIGETTKTVVKVKDPYLAAALLQNHFLARPFQARGIDARACIGSDCSIPEVVTISPGAVLGDRVRLGERVFIGSGAVICDDVSIGDDCVIRPNVTIEHSCELGDRVTIHAGTVIGSDGYGYAQDQHGNHIKRAQLGIVKIGDDVEIGANCCVDRATFGATEIRSGSKLDNLVQVAHNCVLGENCLIVALVGLAGSTKCGRNVVFGGQSGATGHCEIGDFTMVAGKAGVHGDQPPGSQLAGAPAIDAKQYFKATAIFGKLPEMARDLRRLKKDVDKIIAVIEADNR
jgi:UDP-3-O-[3-hydroxymyristoyl] glucosamine N-acyltransferase